MAKIRLQSATSPEPAEVEVSREGGEHAGRLRVVIDGSPHAVEHGGDPGKRWLRIRGRVVPYYAFRDDDRLQVWLGGRTYEFHIVKPTARRAGGAAAAAAAAGTEITAAMPGTVLKVNVKPGDSFEANAALIVMESMKMEMTLSVPFAGTVKELSCKPGEMVEVGRLLARLEPAKNNAQAT